MKICWLCTYDLTLLKEHLHNKRAIKCHPSSWIVNLSNEIAQRNNVELSIISYYPDIDRDQSFEYNGIRFYIIKYGVSLTRRGFPNYFPIDVMFKYPFLRHKILKTVREINPDVIHIHGTENAFGTSVVNDNVFPKLLSIQGIINEYKKYDNNLFFKYQAKIENRVIKRIKYFGSRTEWADNYIKKINPNSQIYYLPEAINKCFFMNENAENQNLIFVGTLNRRKGIEKVLNLFINISKSVVDSKLFIIGKGEINYVCKLKKIANTNNLNERILFLGSQPQENIKKYFNQSTILLHLSEIDNSPNTILEAMAAGLIVIATNTGGVSSLVKDGINGFLIKSNSNQNEISELIIDILKNKNKYYNIIETAKKFVKENNYPENVADMYLKVYKDIIERHKKIK